ncbi:hypothetical protein Tco_1157278 [Tanacetum coccineum]
MKLITTVSELAPQRQELYVKMSLQAQSIRTKKASDYDISDPNIKEAMADSEIEAMQENSSVRQTKCLGKLVDKPFGKDDYKAKSGFGIRKEGWKIRLRRFMLLSPEGFVRSRSSRDKSTFLRGDEILFRTSDPPVPKSRGEYVALLPSCAPSNLDEGQQLQDFGFQLQQKYHCIATLSSHSNLMKPRANIHGQSTSITRYHFIKEQVDENGTHSFKHLLKHHPSSQAVKQESYAISMVEICQKLPSDTRFNPKQNLSPGVDWTSHAEDEQENFALMAYSNSGSDTEVEAQLVVHQKNQLWYEEMIRFIKIDLDDETDMLTYHKKLLAEAVKEKEELKTKLENFQNSSKSLSKLLNSQMSTKDKSGLGYGDQVHEGVLSYENEVFQSVFDSRSSDVEDSPVHDRFANVEGMHAVPPPMTRNYIPSRPDREVDDYMFTYGPKRSKTSESDTQTSNFDSYKSNSSVETLESVPEPVIVEPKIVGQPKAWSDAPTIEVYESDSDDEYVIQPSKEQEKTSFAFVNTVKHVKTPRETVKE